MKSVIFAVLFSTLASACTKPLLVDSYANVTTTGTNAVGAYSSDDGTCGSIASTPGSEVLTLNPGSSKCYYYTNFPNSKPEDAVGGKRSNLSFTLVPPTPNWSFKINIKSWNGTNLVDSYFTPTGTQGGNQTVSIPLTSFNGPDVPNLRNIRSFVFESFSSLSQEWQIGKLLLLCQPAMATTTTTLKTTTTQTMTSTKSIATN